MTSDTGAAGADNGDERPMVLAIDDEERVGQAFQIWLGDDYRVEYATSGADGLEKLSDRTDVVLLDRHMPGMSGSEVLDQIREEGYSCRVIMVTAVDPDFDIIEMPFDDYLEKPVDQEALQAVVSRVLQVGRYDDQMSELYTVTRKIATLETEKQAAALEDNDEYQALVSEKQSLEANLHQLGESLDDDNIGSLFEVIGMTEES